MGVSRSGFHVLKKSLYFDMNITWRIRFLFWWFLDFNYKIKDDLSFKIEKSGKGVSKILFLLPIEKKSAQLASHFIKKRDENESLIRNYFVHEKAISNYSDKILRDCIIYNDDDLNWVGILKTSSIINQINKKNFDALVDLNQNNNRIISLICLEINIPIKVGFQSPLADDLYTLVVQPAKDGFLEKKYELIEKLLNINQAR